MIHSLVLGLLATVCGAAVSAELCEAVHRHTETVMSALKHQGTLPEMVQTGNEIDNGMLWPDGQVWKSGDWDALCELLKAAGAGVKDVDPAVKIVLHLACGGQNAKSRDFLDRLLARGVRFDVIGQSYYPRWHGTLDDLKANLTNLAGRYPQDLMVVEYSSPQLKAINEIVRGLPNGKGRGAFIWEPTKWGPARGALFDRDGSTKPEIDVYPQIATLQKLHDRLCPSGGLYVHCPAR